MRYGPSVTSRRASARMLKDLPSHRSTANDSEAPVMISTVDVTDKIGPRSALGRSASVVHRNVPSKADIRGSIPLAFRIGASLVRVVEAIRLTNMTLATMAATMSGL